MITEKYVSTGPESGAEVVEPVVYPDVRLRYHVFPCIFEYLKEYQSWYDKEHEPRLH